MDPERASVTLHSSWRGIIGTYAGAMTLCGFALAISLFGGVNFVTGTFVVIGVLAVVGTAFDYPLHATFDQDGVVRRALLRRHRLAWDDVTQLSRSRSGLLRGRRMALGSLVAIVGRRRYLLIDQTEGGMEYDAIERLLGKGLSSRLEFDRVMRPADDVAPTWIYRRERWRPPSE